LATDLGLPANVPFKVQSMPDEIESAPCLESVDELVALAQTQRPDLMARSADIRSKESLVANARRAVLPVIATNFDVGKYWFDHHQHEKKGLIGQLKSRLAFLFFKDFTIKTALKKQRPIWKIQERNLSKRSSPLYKLLQLRT